MQCTHCVLFCVLFRRVTRAQLPLLLSVARGCIRIGSTRELQLRNRRRLVRDGRTADMKKIMAVTTCARRHLRHSRTSACFDQRRGDECLPDANAIAQEMYGRCGYPGTVGPSP